MILAERFQLIPVRRLLHLDLNRVVKIAVAHDLQEIQICLAVVLQMRADAIIPLCLVAGKMEPESTGGVVNRLLVQCV